MDSYGIVKAVMNASGQGTVRLFEFVHVPPLAQVLSNGLAVGNGVVAPFPESVSPVT